MTRENIQGHISINTANGNKLFSSFNDVHMRNHMSNIMENEGNETTQNNPNFTHLDQSHSHMFKQEIYKSAFSAPNTRQIKLATNW